MRKRLGHSAAGVLTNLGVGALVDRGVGIGLASWRAMSAGWSYGMVGFGGSQRVYGNKVQIEHSGEIRPLTDEQVEAFLAALLARAIAIMLL